jgi:hypothetical protein
MSPALETLKARLAQIEALEKISRECDPASGLSFSVRRGVARDNEDDERDAERRPWVTVEVCDTAGKEAIAHLVTALRVSVTYWRANLEKEHAETGRFLNGGSK